MRVDTGKTQDIILVLRAFGSRKTAKQGHTIIKITLWGLFLSHYGSLNV